MSREIKFRAWTGRQMMYQDKQYLGSFIRRVVTRVMLEQGSEKPMEHESYLPKGRTIDDYLQQFTGLLDANDKEIYDGDIVLINHPDDRTGDFTNAIGPVFWWDEEGGWYHGNNNGRPPKRMWKYVEVIGNRYENPDLLPEG